MSEAADEVDAHDPLLTVREVGARLKLQPKGVYHLIRNGTLPAVRLGRLLRVRQSELEAYMASLPPARPTKEA